MLAIGFYAAYAPPPLALYGTATILILAFTTRFLPIAYTSSAAGLRSINPEMEEAVRILGGGRLLAIRKVLIPLLKKSLAGAWILVFIPATRELSSAIFLVGPNTRVISVMLFDLSEEGNFEVLSALGVILLVVTRRRSPAIGFQDHRTRLHAAEEQLSRLTLQRRRASATAISLPSTASTSNCSPANSSRCSGLPAAARPRPCG